MSHAGFRDAEIPLNDFTEVAPPPTEPVEPRCREADHESTLATPRYRARFKRPWLLEDASGREPRHLSVGPGTFELVRIPNPYGSRAAGGDWLVLAGTWVGWPARRFFDWSSRDYGDFHIEIVGLAPTPIRAEPTKVAGVRRRRPTAPRLVPFGGFRVLLFGAPEAHDD